MEEKNNIEQKLIKKVMINYFVSNYGKFYSKRFFNSFLIELIFFVSISIFFISLLIENNNYIIALKDVQTTWFHFFEWVMYNNLKYYEELNFFLYNHFNFSIPFNFPDKIITLKFEGWIILISGIIFSFIRNIVYLYQYIIQNKLRNSNIVFLYSPFLLTIYNFFIKDKVILKTIKDIRPEPLRKEQLEDLLNIFFKVNKEDKKQFEIVDNNKHILFFYFKVLELKKIKQIIKPKQTGQGGKSGKNSFNTK